MTSSYRRMVSITMLIRISHVMFRPAHGEENVDVAIITQLIAPILEERAKDGTDVFDLCGIGPKRKESKPDEIVMFCLDCSKSMEEPSDFEELVETGSEDPFGEGLHGAEDSDTQDSVSDETDSDDGPTGMTFGQMKGKTTHNCIA